MWMVTLAHGPSCAHGYDFRSAGWGGATGAYLGAVCAVPRPAAPPRPRPRAIFTLAKMDFKMGVQMRFQFLLPKRQSQWNGILRRLETIKSIFDKPISVFHLTIKHALSFLARNPRYS